MTRLKETERLILIVLLAATAACGGPKTPPVARPAPPPPVLDAAGRPLPPSPVTEPTVVPPEPVIEDAGLNAKDLDTLNRDSPLQPAFFAYDSSELDSAAQQALNANAQLLKQYATWVITIEGHADERGTAEYNLALGERRALTARNYLISLGIAADRLRTISYGKEFPFDPLHSESAWSKNRRAHFVITAK
ncbi:MAG TPA: peptidoglycan-associated lipoprotein Pal [Vicinamibacterales bacterium]|nr:peptidoglycan-associated lipoprotein Pal [Vicinamibacterales bacterium]